MYAIANNEKGTVEHDLKIPKLLYHAEYFAGKILNCVDPYHCLTVYSCFSPEEFLNNIVVAIPARNVQWCPSILYM